MPAPTVACTVLVSVPADAPACSVTVNVTSPPAPRSTVVLIAPVPDGAEHDDPAAAEQTHDAVVTPVGSGSVMVTPGAAEGPALATVMMYDDVAPGDCDVTPFDFATETSATGVRRSLSVAALLAPSGSVTPAGGATTAVFTSVPVASDATVALTVTTALAPTARSRSSETFPLPDAVLHDAPADGVHVHVTPPTRCRDRVGERGSRHRRGPVVDNGDVVADRLPGDDRRDVVGLGHRQVGDLVDVGEVGRRVVGRVGVDDTGRKGDRCRVRDRAGCTWQRQLR